MVLSDGCLYGLPSVVGILRSGGLIPNNGRVFFSQVAEDTFLHGADLSRGASFSIEVTINAANAVRTSTAGVARTVVVVGEEFVPARVMRLFVRRPDGAGGFSTQIVEGAEAIGKYLGL